MTNFAGDNTPHTTEETIDILLLNLKKDTSVLTKWFKDNYFCMNADRCHLLICNYDKDVSLIVESEIIDCSNSVKLLGITIDKKLNFNEHVTKICKKVSAKLHAIARISNFMSHDKLRFLIKSFVESQFSYYPLVWMFRSRALNNRINKLHERGLRLVYKDLHLRFDELLRNDGSVTIHHRNLQKLTTEMYKIHSNLSPSIMKTIFPERSMPYNLWNNIPFQSTMSILSITEQKPYHSEVRKLGH